jgi:hypothetical protein
MSAFNFKNPFKSSKIKNNTNIDDLELQQAFDEIDAKDALNKQQILAHNKQLEQQDMKKRFASAENKRARLEKQRLDNYYNIKENIAKYNNEKQNCNFSSIQNAEKFLKEKQIVGYSHLKGNRIIEHAHLQCRRLKLFGGKKTNNKCKSTHKSIYKNKKTNKKRKRTYKKANKRHKSTHKKRKISRKITNKR